MEKCSTRNMSFSKGRRKGRCSLTILSYQVQSKKKRKIVKTYKLQLSNYLFTLNYYKKLI